VSNKSKTDKSVSPGKVDSKDKLVKQVSTVSGKNKEASISPPKKENKDKPAAQPAKQPLAK